MKLGDTKNKKNTVDLKKVSYSSSSYFLLQTNILDYNNSCLLQKKMLK